MATHRLARLPGLSDRRWAAETYADLAGVRSPRLGDVAWVIDEAIWYAVDDLGTFVKVASPLGTVLTEDPASPPEGSYWVKRASDVAEFVTVCVRFGGVTYEAPLVSIS